MCCVEGSVKSSGLRGPVSLTVALRLQVHYWERELQNQTEKVKVIFVPDTQVHLTNLSSYTPYMVTLTAFNTAGDGPPSDPRGARTQQSGTRRIHHHSRSI